MKKWNEKTNTGEGGKGKRGRTVSDDVGGKSLSDTSTSTRGQCVGESSTGSKSTAILGWALEIRASDQNVQREDIDEAMGEGGGDEEEDGESEDDNEDGHGSGPEVLPLETVRNTTEKTVQLLLQNWCSGQDNYRQRWKHHQ
jgi:hypothetical protein